MPATFLGVRHHSPACARLARATIEALRPAYVLVEGPAEMNGRFDELLAGHTLPIAVYSSYRDGERRHGSWAPFCDYSPEWVALLAGRAAGAQLRFIDLPAWHPALADRRNRYADAEQRYAEAVDRLCAEFAVDNVDALWDRLVESADPAGLAERLDAYFDLVRGDSAASAEDAAREDYMASWISAALAAAGDRPVVVVTGGFHRPALVRLVADAGDTGWPEVPALPADAVGGSYLVPYSFRRMDAFDGYQSGLPSPDYYQQVWERGAEAAASGLTDAVVRRLRGRKQEVSTADLIAARTAAAGLALLRGHPHPARVDVLDGLAGALVDEALDVPLPWAGRGTVRTGSHPVLVEMVAALSGTRRGRLDPATPAPPLVASVASELESEGLSGSGAVRLDLTDDDDLRRSRVLHRLRVLAIPGFTRDAGPATGIDPVLREAWTLAPGEHQLGALIEAGGYGATSEEAAAAALAERLSGIGRGEPDDQDDRARRPGPDIDALAGALFDAALCGIEEVSDRVISDIRLAVAGAPELGPLGRVLGVTVALWRHDTLLGTASSPTLGALIVASVGRVLWLAEGIRGGPAPADLARLAAVTATRDAIAHAGQDLGLDRAGALAVMDRLAADAGVPPDLRGAAVGFGWSLGMVAADAGAVVRGAFAPQTAGDWLTGVFALAREEVVAAAGVLDLLDELLTRLPEQEFLVALPALRQAFTFFPPREREVIAERLLASRGRTGSGRALLRLRAAPAVVAAGRALDEHADSVLRREGLLIP